jgi:F0F1-type ATP synthase membrane subunit b/b'
MVTLNFTLLIELGLFLVFMWVTHKLFFVRALRNMDDREAAIEDDHAQAQKNVDKAKAVHSEYLSKLTGIRRAAETRLAEAMHSTARAHMKFVRGERVRSEETIAKAREKATKDAEAIRDTVIESSPEMIALISECLNAPPGGDES